MLCPALVIRRDMLGLVIRQTLVIRPEMLCSALVIRREMLGPALVIRPGIDVEGPALVIRREMLCPALVIRR